MPNVGDEISSLPGAILHIQLILVSPGFESSTCSYHDVFVLCCAVLFSVAHSCLTLCDPMDCSLPDSSVHGIFQARMLKWVAIISFFTGSPWAKDRTLISCLQHWQGDTLPLYHLMFWPCPFNSTHILFSFAYDPGFLHDNTLLSIVVQKNSLGCDSLGFIHTQVLSLICWLRGDSFWSDLSQPCWTLWW